MTPSYPSTDRILPPAPKKKSPFLPFLLGLLTGTAILGIGFLFWNKSEVIEKFLEPPVRPYEAYLQSLEKSKVAESVMGKVWIEAGQQALLDSTTILPPHLESGYFSSQETRVLTYRIFPRKGQLLSVGMELVSAIDSPQVFMELFELDTRRLSPPELVAFADSGSYQLQYEVEENEVYLLRIQPELLARFNYRLQLVLGASLDFPVAGKDTRAIRSFWGDSRDGGRRKHKGVDIFARRGTPVLAAADGRVRSVRNGGLGGKVVWQRDASQKYNLYYAHLDTQLVRNGQEVSIGDTLGLVGNTGNARFTPPHLHFGIYQRRRGAVDPFPFLDQPQQNPPPLVAADSALSCWHRIKRKTQLYRTPSTKSDIINEIDPETPVRLLAATGKWYLIQTDIGIKAYVDHRFVTRATTILTQEKLSHKRILFDQPHNGVMLAELNAGSELSILAQSKNLRWVRTAEGKQGWIAGD